MDWASFNVKDANLFIRAPAASYATSAADAVRTASEALSLVLRGWAASSGRPLDNIVQRVSYWHRTVCGNSTWGVNGEVQHQRVMNAWKRHLVPTTHTLICTEVVPRVELPLIDAAPVDDI